MSFIELDELAPRLYAVKKSIEGPTAKDAANAMAARYVDIVRILLSHPGRSAPGMPPGMQTGELRESVRATPATGGTVAHATVSPHTRYAAIQEFGGHIYPHGHKYLHWQGARGPVFVRHVYLPPRPYMYPAMKIGKDSGLFKKAAENAIRSDTGL